MTKAKLNRFVGNNVGNTQILSTTEYIDSPNFITKRERERERRTQFSDKIRPNLNSILCVLIIDWHKKTFM